MSVPAEPDRLPLAPGDDVPNHGRWPLLIYRGALPQSADVVEQTLAANGWVGAWRDGIYPFPHYHTTAHEVLVCVRSTAFVRFGGARGVSVELHPGDVAVLPAGTGHQRLAGDDDLLVVGAYPRGHSDWDLRREAPGPEDRARIASVPRPATDPVHGPDGPLLTCWTT